VPLCHTRFAPGDLAKHIHAGVDERAEARVRALLASVQEQERAANKATQDATAIRSLHQFCVQSGLSGRSTVAEALARVRETKEMVSQARDRLDTLAREMRELDGIGLTARRLAEDRDQLSSLGHAVDAPGTEAIDRLIKQFNQQLVSFSTRLNTLTSERGELRRALDSVVGPSDEPNDYMHAVGLLKEHIAITESVRTKVDDALQTFVWPMDGPLAEIITAAESLRQVASEAQRAVARENQL
jgi:uncharacterized phage infection (PIP) family protein YhgE